MNKKQKEYVKNRKCIDILFGLSIRIRTLIGNSFTRNGYKKTSKTQEILGCSFEEFKIHLEKQWSSPNNLTENGQVWMTWENKGLYNGTINYGWDIDHIEPLVNAITQDDIIRLNHYTNFQPLCGYVNRVIKKDN